MKRYLILEDGTVFEGKAFGADVSAVGELVFTTGMCGYIETLTDESYFGQIVMQTFPLIGNYGIIEEDFEGECSVKAYAVREVCKEPSNFRCEKTLDTFLKEKGIPGICGIDTRAVTKRIREKGVMNAAVSDEIPSDLQFIKDYKIENAVESVTCKDITVYNEKGKYNVALIDYGAKRNIIRELVKRDCKVTVMPAFTAAKDILKLKPDGVMLSNGPGDPADNVFQIEVLKELAGNVPIFGICLGHQLLSLALGAKTEKLKYGHRGVNQPVKEANGTRTYITSQNHGYAVVSDSVKKGKISFVNANDGTCEGIDYPEIKAFSVQFHPEACSGPRDTAFLFDRFIGLVEEK
ncbi:MAG: carbamoyl phosphate synthase small subunit [Acutalibacteraceae bacterium]|nr:carbamoyl phosphate synthase small subunit [Acutalibacteraceae bacterium]